MHVLLKCSCISHEIPFSGTFCTNKENIFRSSGEIHSSICFTDFPTNFFDRYGWRNGFSYFCLRYMLRLNSGNYLHITLDEFLVLFATVFCLVDETWYQVLSIVPTTRCVTIGNWFQVSDQGPTLLTSLKYC